MLGGNVFLTLNRFLADRFVTGVCPNCGYDVSSELCTGYMTHLCMQDARGDQCDKCARTFDSAVVLVNPRCHVDGTHKVVPKPTSHMYVKLDEIQPETEKWIKKTYKAGKWSSNSVINTDGDIIDGRLKGGLRPSPVTRDLTWGVPVPSTGKENEDMEKKVLCKFPLNCIISI
jgi:methionyl-tRNA synthetase